MKRISILLLFSIFSLSSINYELKTTLAAQSILGGAGDLTISTKTTDGGGLLLNTRRTGTGIYIDTSNNVGIGTTTPASVLDVIGDITAGNGDHSLGISRALNARGIANNAAVSLMHTGSGGRQYVIMSTGSDTSATFGSAGKLSFYDYDAATTRMVINSSGNIGIGTTSPSALLHLETNNTGGTHLKIRNTDVGGKSWDIISSATGNTSGAGNLHFFEVSSEPSSGSTRLILQSGGNIGIGTTSPDYPLHVNSSGNIYAGFFGPNQPIGVGGGLMVGTTDAPAQDKGGQITFWAPTGSTSDLAAIKGAKENGTSGNTAGYLAFATRSNAGSLGEGMRLSSLGRLGIGTTNPSYRLELPNSTTPGNGQALANAWATYSSGRWKDNIRPIGDALGLISNINGVRFTWKPEHGGKEDIGFVAEDVGKILPELVDWEKDGIHAKSLNYDHIVPVLVEAIKELKSENDSLKLRIEALEYR